jgi:hypothetical protein
MNFFKIINNLFKITEIKHQAKIINYLKKIKLDSIIDIGAHKGDFSRKFIPRNARKSMGF